MNRTVAIGRDADREKTARRLLRSATDKFYDPDVDIDWSAPIPDDKRYLPEHRVSLYGTPLWERMTPEQRIELGKHESVSIASNGIWFEVLLMQLLLKEVYRGDPTSAHVQYMLTEIADECRHSTMFAKAIARYGAPAYGPRPWAKQLARVLPLIAFGPSAYSSILVGEEIPDRMQRENLADESIQPLTRMVNRIHVLEESRHVSFARQEIARGMAKATMPQRAYHRFLTALVAFVIVGELINPAAYAAVGLDPREARRQARNNPHHREAIRQWGERAVSFLDGAGLIGGPGTFLLRRAFLLG